MIFFAGPHFNNTLALYHDYWFFGFLALDLGNVGGVDMGQIMD
jgi:hypothetical protein